MLVFKRTRRRVRSWVPRNRKNLKTALTNDDFHGDAWGQFYVSIEFESRDEELVSKNGAGDGDRTGNFQLGNVVEPPFVFNTYKNR